MRLLLAEDERVLAEQIKATLSSEGHVVDVSHDGEDAAVMGMNEPYDLVILDLGLPQRDGLSILKEWREAGKSMPVLILTARDGWSARVDGLDAGADDYITKPFHMAELSARVRAMLRRASGNARPSFAKDGVVFDMNAASVTRDGAAVELTSQEAAVLSYLIHNSGRLVSQTELSEHIYEYDVDRNSNTIAVFITRLRKKLGSSLIKTVRGRGYMIEAV